MPYLDWIRDADLESEIKHLLERAKSAQCDAEADFGKNVIDPFSAMFVMSGFDLDFDTWAKAETTRQSQKTLQNHIGEFHQNVLGSIDGWRNMRTGNVIDLVSESDQKFAEVKNKYNTISGGKLADLYYSLDSLVMPKTSIYKDYTAYYVAIVPKRRSRYDKVFTPSDKGKGEKCAANEKIREIDGASFYTMASGDENALRNLYAILPELIEKCSEGRYRFDNMDKLQNFFNLAFE